MLVPIIFLAIAVVSASYVSYELLRWVADLVAYVASVDEFGSRLHWWMDARHSVIPAEQHAAVEVCADVYGLTDLTLVGAR